MAYKWNSFTGSLDDVNYGSSFNSSGELQVGNVVSTAVSLLEAKAIKFYQGIAGAVVPATISILAGQPIPIGMGLTFTYAGNIPETQPVSVVSGIRKGQPIPIGMGLTNTYADDIN
jgi:hypothetical protein